MIWCQQFERKQVTVLHLKEHSLVKQYSVSYYTESFFQTIQFALQVTSKTTDYIHTG